MTGIMKFDYKEQDGSRDIYYALALTEYKDLNTPLANNNKQVDKTTGLKDRPSPDKKADSAAKLKKAKDVVDVAKKCYGQANKWRRIAQSNDLKDLAINNADKIGRLIIK